MAPIPGVPTTAAALDPAPYDLLVIGGGITGAGILRDAAMRGMRALLIDQSDLGAGTSSASSRLAHGGLRYLEHFQFRLVFEALHERGVLLRIAPHLVHPLAFAFPNHQHDRVPLWRLGAGLWLYHLLAGRQAIQRHQLLGRKKFLEQEPLIRAAGLRGGAIYWDAQCDDARLVVATARAAAAAGGTVITWTRVEDFLRGPNGTITGVQVVDRLTGAPTAIQARAVVNATGPWTDQIRRLEDSAAQPILRPTKGVHILIDAARLGHRHAITFVSPIDGRVMFVLPWGRWSYVGTTDTDTEEAPDALTISDDDRLYLLRSVNAMFPTARLGEEDIRGEWAGLRPLLKSADGCDASAVSREHRVLVGPGGMVTVAGGKLTTYRRMAAEAVDVAVRHLAPAPGAWRHHPPTATVPLPGGESAAIHLFRRDVEAVNLPSPTVDHLLHTYGSEAVAVAHLVRDDPALAEPLHPDHPAIAAEAVFAARREYVRRVEDLLVRRIHLFHETADRGAAAALATARLLGRERGWTEPEITAEAEAYAGVANGLPVRG